MRKAKSISEVCGISRVRELRRPLGRGLTRVSWLAVLASSACAALPAAAGASLPDGRVYEQVSPANKDGNVVGNPLEPATGAFGLAAGDGNAAVFVGSGAMGTSFSGMIDEFVARRSASGWTTSSAVPREQGTISFTGGPLTVVPSSDFSRFLFAAFASYVSTEPLEAGSSTNIFLSEDPAVEPTWIARPTISDPIPAPGQNNEAHDYLIAGGTPSLDTVYFTYSGTLVAQDESRASHVGGGQSEKETSPWGFYEWSDGALSAAGVLPDGTLDPWGAVPAALAGATNFERFTAADQAHTLDNEVSSDGSRAFFMSPDPNASTVTNAKVCETEGPCTTATPELYVRERQPDGSTRTVLVSQSQLEGHVGEPAPDGLVRFRNSTVSGTYVYASPDGSQAFFESADRLTSAAPSDNSVKEYDYDVETGTLTYLPGVSGSIAASSSDGSDFIFENTATTPAELELWTTGPGGGRITQVTQLEGEGGGIGNGRASADGSVFVFTTSAPVPGGFNNAGGFEQLYRYDVATSSLACVSCLPEGVAPSGDADVSYDNAGGYNSRPMSVQDTRVVSADGSKVFFDTPDSLVPADTNGMRDVYEWEDGRDYLISSGKSVENAYLLDSSTVGNDVFFTTDYGLVAGDVDGSYDVYDARVPRPGDIPQPLAVPCQGDVCQGPPSVPSLLGTPASATFSGAGNLEPTETKPAVKKKTVKKKAKRSRKPKRSKRKKARRARKSARKIYGREH